MKNINIPDSKTGKIGSLRTVAQLFRQEIELAKKRAVTQAHSEWVRGVRKEIEKQKAKNTIPVASIIVHDFEIFRKTIMGE